MNEEQPLTGRTIGVTADRRGDDQAVMFGRLGAEVLVGPTIATVALPDPDDLKARTESLIADPPEYLIADTGIGIRTWMAAAEEWGLAVRLKEALGQGRIASRGPKASGALSSAGLPAWWKCPTEQLDDLIDHLLDTGVSGKRVAFQLHGDDGADFVARLEGAGAAVTTLPVYQWTRPDDVGPAQELIGRCCDGSVDAVTFTAAPQVRSLLALAEERGRRADLLAAMNGDVVVGCIGPVCAAAATEAGIHSPVVPPHWRLGALVKTVTEALAG